MGAYQYEHYEGTKLTQRQLDDRASVGLELVEHKCSADMVHRYIFKRKKED